MDWNLEQQEALTKVKAWIAAEDSDQVFRLFGYAGTGKTTLARELAADVSGAVQFGAYTGKAAYVLQTKGCPARTIHSLIYLPRGKATARLAELEDQLRRAAEDDRPEWESYIREEKAALKRPSFTLNTQSCVLHSSLVVIDEVSMVGTQVGTDLLSFGTPVLVLGDPAQLPPVRDGGFFTKQEPDAMLTQVHRHAGSVLELATLVRSGGKLLPGLYGDSAVLAKGSLSAEAVMAFDVVLTGKNMTRRILNRKIRKHLGRTGPLPEQGDKLICTRNNHEAGLLNGSQWTVHEATVLDEDRIELLISDGNREDVFPSIAWRHHFEGREDELSYWEVRENDHFDFGYAMTCHKAQGSQWDRVLVIDESRTFCRDWRRWLYTAITRASKSVTVLT